MDGTAAPDNWLVSRANLRIQQETIAHKEVRLVLAPGRHGVESKEEDVPESLRNVPSLSHEQAQQLASMALELERHYQYPQDVEWAVDEDDQIILLQTRPMGLDASVSEVTAPALSHLRPLLSGGEGRGLRPRHPCASFAGPHPLPRRRGHAPAAHLARRHGGHAAGLGHHRRDGQPYRSYGVCLP